MTFNQQLIAKARKGEIAILNDGSVDELRCVLKHIWPEDQFLSKGEDKFYWASNRYKNNWYSGEFRPAEISTAHSVKDFFMDQPESKESFKKYLESTADQELKSRTYRVTRQQMKEIWEASHEVTKLMALMNSWFTAFENEVEIGEDRLMELRRCFNQREPEVLKKYFPAYFFIPEGEPVLVLDSNMARSWLIRISDGKGGVYIDGRLSGESVTGWEQIIPFTKNPPK